MTAPRITTPDHAALAELADRLRELGPELETVGPWPARQLQLCADYGVFEWFVPIEWGGQDWTDADVFRAYLPMSAACLTTTFVITQRSGACSRLARSDNEELKKRYLPDLARGRIFATVGISHLTTSRRHLRRPVLLARETDDGFVLDGFSPWVTGAPYADLFVLGATLADGREILAAVPRDLPGVEVPAAAQLVGLTASQTGPVQCNAVRLDRSLLLAGPVEGVMRQGAGANTGGLQTSTLALGLARAAIDFLQEEAQKRTDLAAPSASLDEQWLATRDDLLRAADGAPNCSNEALRTRCNSLVLRAAQAVLSAAKGSGYVVGHPAGRWCREALFFLVWSCPQPVLAANLCELAGIEST